MNFQIIPIAEASVTTLMKSINRVIINPLIVLLFALAMVYFIYGLAKYLLSPDNEEVRKNSKSQMLWGIVGMFIMISVFGILSLVMNTIGVKSSDIKINSTDITVGNIR
jgi:heme/copper-type cytochrome/quinol oxidase subunit 2